jgi:beta-phosphoglucomutase-like phosphatase (HAD superfamily)
VTIEAVVFDLDGVLVDSEHVWDDVRETLARERGGRWHDRAQTDMMGMSSREWSHYMHEVIGLADSPDEINAEVVRRLLARYERGLPLFEGAAAAVSRLAAEFRLAVASSSNRPVIDSVLRVAGLEDLFEVTVSSEEVARGSRRPTSISRPHGAYESSRAPVRRSRTPATGSGQRALPGCGC